MLPLRRSLRRSLCALSACALFARSAAAEDPRACISASTAGQDQRDQGKYRAARASFVACANESCPAPVRRDCSQWLAEVDDAMPTILVAATDAAGHDLDDVRVSVDGELLLTRLDGMPKPVDPGPHAFRCEAAGQAPVDLPVVVHAGERNRIIAVRFARSSATATGTAAITTASPAVATTTRTLAWVFGAVAVVAFGSEAYFGLSGISQRNRDTAPGACAPSCAPSEKNDVQTKFFAADVSLGAGLVAAAAAIYFALRTIDRRDAPGPAGAPAPARDGAATSELWRF